ncbi:hypothetical protein [Konateibacter massiliensis]|uniref:hypothetical protein n=1 Tax=Konateibacter massiliensis TaxID=2002841 RepID=UPI000C15A572|nr:hypothetical protein [Konateibacter massiliensis]
MLNEDRIKLMTRMAAYEAREGKEEIPVSKFFRIDFVTSNMLKTAISTTIAFCIIAAMWAGYHAEFLMENIHKMDLLEFSGTILKYYLIFMAVYLTAAYFVYMIRYKRAKMGVKKYYGQLKRLSRLYEKEDYKNDSRKSLGGKTEHDRFTGI